MKKIKCYDREPSFDFHKEVVKRKRNANAATVQGMETALKNRFELYEELFASNELEALVAAKYSEAQCEALRDMYSYSAKKFVELKHFYLVDNNGRLNDTCPNCQMDTITSFDHLVPQSEFPEYSDDILNLIPCCVLCNGHKNNIWRESGKRKYLNLFLDDIPDVQFLFAKISVIEEKLSIRFNVQNTGNIDTSLFDRINNHYTKLDLLNRYKTKADSVIASLANDIQTYVGNMPDETIVELGIKRANQDQKKYGVNYWKSVLQIAALKDAVVLNYLKTCVL